MKPAVLKPQSNDKHSNILTSSMPSIINPSKQRRRVKGIDSSPEGIRNLVKSNQQLESTLQELSGTRDALIDKIERMESELISDQDLIASLRGRVANLGLPVEYTNYNSAMISGRYADDDTQSYKEITIDRDNFHKYVHENPTIMRGFSNTEPGFHEYISSFEHLDASLVMDMISKSLHQVHKISKCFELYEKMSEVTQNENFESILQSLCKNLFSAHSCRVFMLDHASHEYTHQETSLDFSGTLIGDVINAEKVQIVNDVRNSDHFNRSVDGMFIESNTALFIPIGSEGLVILERQEFGNEEVEAGKFLALLLEPLVLSRNRASHITKQVASRRILHLFEMDLVAKTTFETLLPYLLTSLNEFVGANDVELFLVRPDAFSSFDVDEQKRLVQKKFPRAGTLNWVVQNNEDISVARLDKVSCECYDSQVDKWSKGKSYAAFPVMDQSKGTVVAVLCLSDRIGWNKFTVWDMEITKTMCASLSLVLPMCIQNAEGVIEDERVLAFKTFPLAVETITFSTLENPKAVELIAKLMQETVNCEWMTIYIKRNDSDEIKRLITMHNLVATESNFLDPAFMRRIFAESKEYCVKESEEIDGFKTIRGMSSHAFLSSVSKEHYNSFMVVAMNSKSVREQFEPAYVGILKAFCTFIEYRLQVGERNQIISRENASNMILTNAFNISESLLGDAAPLNKLLKVTTELLSMESYLLVKYKPMSDVYTVILSSENQKQSPLPVKDSLMSKIRRLKMENGGMLHHPDFLCGDYAQSCIVKCFPPFTQLLVRSLDQENKCVVIFAGRSLASNHNDLFYRLLPLLLGYVEHFELEEEIGMNKDVDLTQVNPESVSIRKEDLISLDFNSRNYDENQKLEILIAIFSDLGLDDFTEKDKLADFLMKVRAEYNSSLQFHNWDHIIDCTQFMYAVLETGKDFFESVLSKETKYSLFLTCLLHDIDHDGFNSTFHSSVCTPLYFVYGDISCQEKHHISVAMKLIQDFLIDEKSSINKNALFWDTLVQSILSSNLAEQDTYLASLEHLPKDFTATSDGDCICLSQLIFNIANAAACFRPFDQSKQIALAVLNELQNEHKTSKDLGYEMPAVPALEDLEIAFIEGRILKLTESLANLCGQMETLKARLQQNLALWKQ